MSFRTELHFSKEELLNTPKILYQHQCLMLGSCFTENISQRLIDLGYAPLVNPFGISYQPFAMLDTIDRLLDPSFCFTADHLFEYQGKYHSFLHHGSYSHIDPQQALNQINHAYLTAKQSLAQLDFLLITLGTSWGYRLKSTMPYPMLFSHRIVNNCHQLPNHCFERELLSMTMMQTRFIQILDALLQLNPRLKIIFTISPIRHIKDQLIQNQRSKAQLFVLMHDLIDRYPNQSFYFPAYELLMDDLRDYRFYASDMLHPSELAIQYIWDKFEALYLSASEKELRLKIIQLKKALNHKILDPLAPKSIQFIREREEKKQALLAQFPMLKL